MATKKISELPAVSGINESDLFIVSQGSGSTYGSLKATLVGIAKKILTNIQYASELQTSDKTITGAINELNTAIGQVSVYTDVYGTLEAGETTVTLTDSSIGSNSHVEPYTNVFGVSPTNMVVASGSVTLTFPEQGADVGVCVRVS